MVRRYDVSDDGMQRSEDIDVAVTYLGESAKAYKVNGGKEDIWLPKSQCIMDRQGNSCTVTLPEWLAKEKRLI